MNWVAFFRGINVGGKNIVKMEDLRQLFTDLGLCDVKTYIQSGNVLFTSSQDEAALSACIGPAFAARFGFSADVVLRTGAELSGLLRGLPFSAAEVESATADAPDVEHLYVYLSAHPVDRPRLEQLCAAYSGQDKLHIAEREVYLLCRQSVRDSKLALLLAKLPQALTARNLKTIAKLEHLTS